MIYGCGFEFDVRMCFLSATPGGKIECEFFESSNLYYSFYPSRIWHDIPKMAQEIMVKKN